jgi:peptide/nickel transport system substrate-binding protein
MTYRGAVPEGGVSVGGVMPPSGTWALPVEDVEESPGYGEDTQGDLKQAEVLLAGAGYSGGLSATIAVQGDRLSDDVQFVVSRLAMVGVDASVSRIEPVDWKEFLERGEYDLALVRSILPVHDTDVAFFGMYSCDAPVNYGGYCDRDLDKLIEGQSKEQNVGLRLKEVHHVQRRLLEDVADVVLGWEINYVMLSSRLRGWQLHPSPYNNVRMQDVWLNKRPDS